MCGDRRWILCNVPVQSACSSVVHVHLQQSQNPVDTVAKTPLLPKPRNLVVPLRVRASNLEKVRWPIALDVPPAVVDRLTLVRRVCVTWGLLLLLLLHLQRLLLLLLLLHGLLLLLLYLLTCKTLVHHRHHPHGHHHVRVHGRLRRRERSGDRLCLCELHLQLLVLHLGLLADVHRQRARVLQCERDLLDLCL